jgi:hypothetical protein
MLTRCNDETHDQFAHYGGRGIRVCQRWHDFAAFIADMGTPPVGTSIERVDNAKGYEPGNCRWATRHEQMRNTRHNVWVMVSGERMVKADACKQLNVLDGSFRFRMRRYGETLQQAIDHYARNGGRSQRTEMQA